MIESPKGEYGFFCWLWTEGFLRARIRVSDFLMVNMLDFFKGFMLCDLVGLLGNFDLVFGSIDR